MDRGYSYYGEVRLGHSFIPAILDYILDNGPHLSPWAVLSLRTSCPLGCFVPWDVLSVHPGNIPRIYNINLLLNIAIIFKYYYFNII